MPARLGIEASASCPEAEQSRPGPASQLRRERHRLFRQIDQEALEAAASLGEGMDAARRALFGLGVRSAPLFFGFALFIAEQSRVDRVSRLCFFTREGELFHQVFERVFPEGRFAGLELPPAEILEVSRLATFSASLGSLSLKEMMRLWTLYSSQSIFALGKSLGIEPEQLGLSCARHGIALAEDIIRPWEDDRVARLFADADFKRIVIDKIERDRQAAALYFERRGVATAGDTVGIVDIGWRGTIQDNIALMLPQTRFVGYYMGLQRFLNVQPPNCLKKAFGPNANRDLLFSHLLDAVSPMEMLCNSPHGSVMGYRTDGNGDAVAIRLTEASETAIYTDTVRHFQDGVLFALPFWSARMEPAGLRSAELREMACGIWTSLITKPDRQISEAYAALNHNDVFGVGCFVDKKVVPSPIKLLRSLVFSRDRRDVILYIKQTQWTSGLWHRRDLAVLHKAVLVAALSTGRAYKRTRMWMQHHWKHKGQIGE